jgi:hypothetical protein
VKRQEIILFEGPDGVGKTSIAKGLSQATGIPYFKMNSEHDNWRKGKFREALEFDQTYLSQFLRQTGCSVIIDRAWPSEWVYSRVFKRDTNHLILQQLDLEWAALGAKIIIPWRQDYSKNREDELIPKEKLKSIHDKYFDFIRWTKCNVIPLNVDYYKDDLKSELDYLFPLLAE